MHVVVGESVDAINIQSEFVRDLDLIRVWRGLEAFQCTLLFYVVMFIIQNTTASGSHYGIFSSWWRSVSPWRFSVLSTSLRISSIIDWHITSDCTARFWTKRAPTYLEISHLPSFQMGIYLVERDMGQENDMNRYEARISTNCQSFIQCVNF